MDLAQGYIKKFLAAIPDYPFQEGSSLNAAGINYNTLKADAALKRLAARQLMPRRNSGLGEKEFELVRFHLDVVGEELKRRPTHMAEAPLYVKLLMFFFVVVYMVSVTMETTRGEIITALDDRRRIGLALLSNLVIVPLLGFVLVRLFDLRPEIRIGLMMLALSPGGLFALQFARVSKGNRVFAVALLIILSVLAILITPVLAYWFFHREGPVGGPLAWLMVLFLFLIAGPLLVGRALQMRFPEVAPKLGRRLGLFSIAVFIMAALLSGRFKTPALKAIGADGIVAIVVLTVACWAVGWMLGGPEIKNRKVLAISTAMRNFGVCVPLANHYFFDNEGVIATILAYSAISIPMNMVFALVTGRTLRDPSDGASRADVLAKKSPG